MPNYEETFIYSLWYYDYIDYQQYTFIIDDNQLTLKIGDYNETELREVGGYPDVNEGINEIIDWFYSDGLNYALNIEYFQVGVDFPGREVPVAWMRPEDDYFTFPKEDMDFYMLLSDVFGWGCSADDSTQRYSCQCNSPADEKFLLF